VALTLVGMQKQLKVSWFLPITNLTDKHTYIRTSEKEITYDS